MGRAFQQALEPVALPEQIIRLEPTDELRRVVSLEPVQDIGPIDVAGSVASGSESQPQEITDLEMQGNQVGQFRILPLTQSMELEVRQTGQQEQRYGLKNVIGHITSSTPPNLSEVYVQEDGVPYLVVRNASPEYDLSATLVNFSGFKYVTEKVSREEMGKRQQPISFPIDKLEAGQRGSNNTRASGRRGSP